MNRVTLLPCLLMLLSLTPVIAQEFPSELAGKGDLRFMDDFQRNDLGEWKVIIPGFKVADGVLVESQDRDDHGSVGLLQSPGIGHPTKQSVHFTVSGKETLFDDVRIWDVVAIRPRDAS